MTDPLPPGSRAEEASKLDCLIAEKILGWTRSDGEGDWNGPSDVTFFDADDDYLTVYWPGCEEPSEFVSFSKRIADAWRVVEKLGFDIVLTRASPHTGGPVKEWECCLYRDFWRDDRNGDGYPAAVSVAETAPLAICRAALVLVEKP